MVRDGAGPAAIGADVSSLLFLHACERPGRNAYAYTGTWNFADTAELLGWYEVVYEDGFVQSVPLRYGLNILEADWGKDHAPKALAYEAEAVERGSGTLFAYEWVNPRFGKAVKEVRLRAAGAKNGVFLAALSAAPRRVPPEPKPLRIIVAPNIPKW